MAVPPAQEFDLHGRCALVTGGGRGLGRAMAVALGRAGADVVVTARSADQLDATLDELSPTGGAHVSLPWDLADRDRVAELVPAARARVGRVDVLVHAAGIQVRKPALEMTATDWDAVHDVHLRAAFLLAQAVARDLVREGQPGSIVLIASLTATIAVPSTAAYGAAKTGVTGLVRSLALEWAPHGVRVNAIAPGWFQTALTAPVFDDRDRRADVIARIPMGRPGDPAELGGAVVYLASDASSYVTGQVLTVDGGRLVS